MLPLGNKNNEEKHDKEVRKDQKARNTLPQYPCLPVVVVTVHGDEESKSKTQCRIAKEITVFQLSSSSVLLKSYFIMTNEKKSMLPHKICTYSCTLLEVQRQIYPWI